MQRLKMKVEDEHNPFEDSKEEFEGSTVNLKRNEKSSKVSLSKKLAYLFRKFEGAIK